MFTGIIEQICSVKAISLSRGTLQLKVDLDELAADAKIGDSIAINGTCLTMVKLDGAIADFDVSGETIEKSTAGRLKIGDKVNCERALKPTDRFGGHFVLGHVDGTGSVAEIRSEQNFSRIKIAVSAELLGQIVVKGSVAVNGISLTIAEMDNKSFTVVLIPATLKQTTLGHAKVGDAVNIETDIITKTIIKQLENLGPKSSLTAERLRELGY